MRPFFWYAAAVAAAETPLASGLQAAPASAPASIPGIGKFMKLSFRFNLHISRKRVILEAVVQVVGIDGEVFFPDLFKDHLLELVEVHPGMCRYENDLVVTVLSIVSLHVFEFAMVFEQLALVHHEDCGDFTCADFLKCRRHHFDLVFMEWVRRVHYVQQEVGLAYLVEGGLKRLYQVVG